MSVKKIYHITALVALVFLSACQNLMNFTPERAVLQSVVNDAASRGWQVDSDSIRIVQKQSFQDHEIFLILFQGEPEEGTPQECTFVYHVVQERGGWRVGGSGGGCGPSSTEKVTVGAGSRGGGSSEIGTSYVYGLVKDPVIQSFKITWADDEVQTAQVINGSFLAIREYVQNLEFELLEGLDANDNVAYSFDRDAIPPEKQGP